ncbi:methyltransferase [Streptomyces canus]|uniref:methyltransferase n=1 Tax=Streptomyces canus TaxID=58343 RepID=UPI0027D91506|nr:methyltransferase [Streptomyces canus]
MPEGGDVSLLSRVLHDWDDERCLTILRRCARAMRAGTELLVVERLLAEAGFEGDGLPWSAPGGAL